MHRRITTSAAVAAVAVAAPLMLAGCTSKSGDDDAIEVTSSESSCDLATTDAATGEVAFTVTNTGNKVTEFYVYGNNNRVLGEVENIGPGVKGKLVVEIVDPGTYTVACKPGMVGTGIRKDITVSGEKKEKSEAPADVNAAKVAYIEYVRNQLNTLQAQTKDFVNNVKSGNLDAARAQFGLTRTSYERIEPVAESFQDLDPAIDMRWDDTEGGTKPFTGFHRIERYLWPPQATEIGDATGQISPDDAANAKTADTKEAIDKVADELMANVDKLHDEVNKADFNFETQSFVKGPQALIDEIAATKVAGEEDRYSHTDLWDIAANLDGSETAIATMQPIISAKNKPLMDKITQQFADVRTVVDQFREGDGYPSYTKVTPEQRRNLSNKIDTLSATLSQVPGLVLQK